MTRSSEYVEEQTQIPNGTDHLMPTFDLLAGVKPRYVMDRLT